MPADQPLVLAPAIYSLVRFVAMPAGNLSRPHLVIIFAWLLHAISWFLPVAKLGGDHSALFQPIRGWFAFRVALSGVWPFEGIHSDA